MLQNLNLLFKYYQNNLNKCKNVGSTVKEIAFNRYVRKFGRGGNASPKVAIVLEITTRLLLSNWHLVLLQIP